jgi:hypothetical protein
VGDGERADSRDHLHAISAVSVLRKGHSEARESEPVRSAKLTRPGVVACRAAASAMTTRTR